jgi:hypothetical protein
VHHAVSQMGQVNNTWNFFLNVNMEKNLGLIEFSLSGSSFTICNDDPDSNSDL